MDQNGNLTSIFLLISDLLKQGSFQKKRMRKRLCEKEVLESPELVKLTKRDETMLKGILEIQQRFADAEKQRWAYLRIPFPILTWAEEEAAMRRLEEAAIVHFATTQGAKTYNFFVLTWDGSSDAGLKTLFGEESSMLTWFKIMLPFLVSEDASIRKKAKEWLFERMDTFFNSMASKWNVDHARFHMKWDQIAVCIKDLGTGSIV